ncbi:cytidylyltransferase domain-containing protein [Spirochaeta isovalerica]|uniref:Spore coat polysaccharide biosynthesis protein SpsF (Cytidylyltransferase family)/SAM-dependent methyltransferase n=1 Tax=Spirochaeta isovalerica TaxID=150 RepID=A0A841R7I2_9SPIO|nr:spore coat polysaccharide biosynthesis protein SpsF (cytidylyltransferase family)/SAM-dependent methyltransferase [Spirochaeta isovalerica]
MNTAVCLQVRLDSSRLPGKALIKIEDLTIVEHAMRAIGMVDADLRLLLTTEECLDDLAPLAEKWNFIPFAGPKEDVLLRFVQAARKYDIRTVIRATGDNPLVSARMADEVLAEHRKTGADYSNWPDAPLGTGIEIVETSALERALAESSAPYDHEHVTPWIYNNPGKFHLNIHRVPPEYYFTAKVSVDTAEDLDKIRKIFSDLYRNRPTEIDELVNYLKNRTILIPSTVEGNGTGHIKRMISLASKLKGAVSIYIDSRHLERVLPTFPDEIRPLIVSSMEKPETYGRIVVDSRVTSEDFFLQNLQGGNVIAIDEGGPLRRRIPYLIDILPLPERFGKPNISSLSFLDLPERSEPAATGEKILISFGGEDPAGLTTALCRFIEEECEELIDNVTVVLGPQYRGSEPDRAFHILRNPPSLRAVMKESSAVICSYGLTAYEAASLSLPVLLINPSAYHEELSDLSGFASTGVGPEKKSVLERFLKNPRNFPIVRKDFSGPAFSETIESLNPSGRGCPLCGSADFDVEARFEEKTYCRCRNCSMLFMINYAPEKMSYGEEYFFEQYEKQYGKTYIDDFDHLCELAGSRLKMIGRLAAGERKRLLDCGCAYGPFLKKSEQYGYKPFGTDISPDAVEYVSSTLGYKVVQAPFESFYVPEEWDAVEFDVLTMWYVIEHFPDLQPVLKKVNRLVRTGGIFAFSTPSGSGISSLKDRLDFLKLSPDDHYTVWEPELSASFLERYGFRIEKIRVTGHHPERFPSILARSGAGRSLLNLYSHYAGLGDTFEIYARKVKDL